MTEIIDFFILPIFAISFIMFIYYFFSYFFTVKEPKEENKKIIRGVICLIISSACVVIYFFYIYNSSLGIATGGSGVGLIPTAPIPNLIEIKPGVFSTYTESTLTNEFATSFDNREFLKIRYFANIYTTGAAREKYDKIKEIIHRHNGTISLYKEYTKTNGVSIENIFRNNETNISFTINKNQFEKFEEDIKSLSFKNLYSSNISKTNKLDSKKYFENNEKVLQQKIESLNNDKVKISSDYDKNFSIIQSRIEEKKKELSENNYKLVTYNLKIQKATSSSDIDKYSKNIAEINTMINDINNSINNLNKQLEENKSDYITSVSSSTNTINSTNLSLQNNKQRDKELIESVEIVEGNITINQISYLGILHLYINLWIWTPIVILSLLIWNKIRLKRKYNENNPVINQ